MRSCWQLHAGGGKPWLCVPVLQVCSCPVHAVPPCAAALQVDWYPWGEEAFERARRDNKPIFLSVGYRWEAGWMPAGWCVLAGAGGVERSAKACHAGLRRPRHGGPVPSASLDAARATGAT